MKIFFFVSLLFVVHAFADNSNTGTVGVVCYKNNKISSVELLDLFEARSKGLVIRKDITGSFEKESFKIFKKIYKSEGDAHKEVDNLTYFKSKLKAIKQDSKLELLPDNYPLLVPKNCELQQVTLVYNDRTIYIDTVLYNLMDHTNKLAVIFHDYLYRDETRRDVTDSRYTRTIVGHAFSTSDPFDLGTKIGDIFKFLTGVICMDERAANEDTNEKVMLVAKKDKKMFSNSWKFEFIILNGHQMFAQKTGHFDLAFDIAGPPSGALKVSTSILESKINPGESMTVKSSKDGIFVSWKGTDPTDEFTDLKLVCTKPDLSNL